MAIVKANGYGHGVEAVARALADCVDGFGVANVTEAKELAAAIGDVNAGRILIFSPLLPEERIIAIDAGFSVFVSNEDEVTQYALSAKATGKPARLHVMVDTGMGRVGVRPDHLESLVGFVRETASQSGNPVRFAGIATHFPSADEDGEFTRQQIARFRELIAPLKLGPEVYVHVANSAGLLEFGREAEFATHARPGLALYGVSPIPRHQASLQPAMTWKTRITLVRDIEPGDSVSYGRTFVAAGPMRVATLAVGYADGYPRSLSGQQVDVLIGGRRCPLLGRVTMDQIVVDTSALAEPPKTGDEAVLMGRQGDEEIRCAELAEKAGTIPWEIFTGISGRVARRYR